MRVALQSARLRRIACCVRRQPPGQLVRAACAGGRGVRSHAQRARPSRACCSRARPCRRFWCRWSWPALESSRGREISALYWFEAAVTGALVVLVWHFWLPAVLVLVAVDGTAALAASALLRARVAAVARAQVLAELPPLQSGEPGLAEEEQGREQLIHEAERHANAALNVAFSTTFVLGPMLGGVLVAGAGAPTALLIDVALVPDRRCAPHRPCLRPRRGASGDLGAGSPRRRLATHQPAEPAAPRADRRVRRADLHPDRWPDRGHLRQVDAARRRPRARDPARGLGGRLGGRAASSSHGSSSVRCRC